MVVECGVSLYAAQRAHSVALLAFGSDSLIEFFSALVVLFQFLPRFPLSRKRTEQCAAVLLFLLAGAVVCIAIVSSRMPVETSLPGIVITALALIAMPVLATLKRREARRIGNTPLAADATQSATCAYLAAVTLVGLAINALWRISWVDAAAALAAVPILAVEGRRTWRGEACGCANYQSSRHN
jgi:divalent metal cation (Fe/Co/Zn/Cd) transporter